MVGGGGGGQFLKQPRLPGCSGPGALQAWRPPRGVYGSSGFGLHDVPKVPAWRGSKRKGRLKSSPGLMAGCCCYFWSGVSERGPAAGQRRRCLSFQRDGGWGLPRPALPGVRAPVKAARTAEGGREPPRRAGMSWPRAGCCAVPAAEAGTEEGAEVRPLRAGGGEGLSPEVGTPGLPGTESGGGPGGPQACPGGPVAGISCLRPSQTAARCPRSCPVPSLGRVSDPAPSRF